MLDFKYLEKNRINEYKKYYNYNGALGCEFNFVSAYLWTREYELRVAVYDDTLIKAYYRGDGTIWGYCMPSGKNVQGAVEAVFDDAKQRGQNPFFGYMSLDEREKLESLYPGAFEFRRSPTTQDYIYLTSDLALLAGKKYHGKRNHISKFYRTYGDIRVEDITPQNSADALEVARLWCVESDEDPASNAELSVIREALDNQAEFSMRGIVLYAGEKPVAMTLGSEISSLCFDVNFEKALREFDGSYSVVCNEFAKRLTEYKYLNREEDMGIEGLKKSKLSYHPVIIYDRFDGVLKWT